MRACRHTIQFDLCRWPRPFCSLLRLSLTPSGRTQTELSGHTTPRSLPFCWFFLQMPSRSQQAGIWPAICSPPSHEASCHRRSSAPSSTVHTGARWGNTRPAARSFHTFLIRFLLVASGSTSCQRPDSPAANADKRPSILTPGTRHDTCDPQTGGLDDEKQKFRKTCSARFHRSISGMTQHNMACLNAPVM